MPNPTLNRLIAEHKVIAAMMEIMRNEVFAFETMGSFDLELIRLILRYMSAYPDRFHHPKEEILLDLAAAMDKSFEARASKIRIDHEELPATTDAIEEIIGMLLIGANLSRDDVLRSLKGYVAGELDHMRMEREEIFPALEALLTPAQWQTADELMNGVDDPLHGGGDPGPYKRLQEIILGTGIAAA